MMKGLARLIILGILCVFFTEGVIFTTKPQNPFFALEGSNSSLEWRYTFGNESFRQGVLTFGNNRDIAERFVGDSATWIKPSYKSRLQAKITNNSTSITLSRVKRTDGGTYQLKVISNPNRARAISQVEISVHYLDQPNIVITESSTPHEGTDVTLSCNVEGKPEPNVSWTMNGFPIDTRENASIYISDDQRRLTIANVQRTDNGEYRCVANNSVGNSTSAASKFDVLYRPKITVHPNAVSKAEGSRIILSCNATGNPEPKISWTKDGFSLNSSRISFSKYHKKLIILNVTKRDSGKYVCIATNDVGEDTSNATLVDIQYIPKIRGHYINVKAEEGRNATLFCNATGNPVPTLSWTKDGSVITRSSKIKLSADQNSYLTVTNVSRTDSGEYLCVAKNSLGNDTSSGIELDVQYRPEITFHPNAVTKPEGSSVILYCNATGNPEPTISWTKIGFSGQLHNNSGISYSEHHKKLTIAKVNRRDSGKYECAATNDVGKDVSSAALVDVTYKPEITTSPHNVTKKEGENVTLTCNATGNPEPTISWTKNGLLLTVKTGISFSPDNKKLKIGNVKREDSGIYQCVANNTLGKDNSTSAEVNVQYQAKISTHPSNITKKEGEDVTLYCNATGNPVPSISWTKDGSPITFNTRTILSKDKNLKITNVHGADRGEYRCVAKNSLGNDTSYPATLKVQFKPEVAIDGDQEQFIAKGENVTLICRYNTSTPVSEVQWIKDGEVIAINSTVTKNGSRLTITYYNDSLSQLLIASASPQDSGNYTCNVSNEVNSTVASTSIDIQEKPSAILQPETVTVKEGENVTLFCNSSGSSLSITWQFNGSDVTTLGDSRISFSVDNKSLIITNVTRKQKGEYKCVARNKHGDDASNIAVVSVKFEPEVTIDGDQEQFRAKGENFTLICRYNSSPSVSEVQWIKDGKVIAINSTATNNGSRVTITHYHGSLSQLSIASASSHDSGTYTCNVTNELNSTTDSTSIVIQVTPSIETNPQASRIREGENLTLFCNASGSSLTTSWTKNGSNINSSKDSRIILLADNEQLTITNVSRTDKGAYQCVVSNDVGNATSNSAIVTVQFGPEISQPPSNTTKVEGQTVVFSCVVAGYPTPDVAWKKDEDKLDLAVDKRFSVSSEDRNHNLSITDVQNSDTGQYRCVANNSLGSFISTPASLTVQFAPEVTIDGDQMQYVANGTNLQLTCRFKALPPVSEVQWVKDGNVIASTLTAPSNGSRVDISHSNESQAQLLITAVSLRDSGNYTCNVTNNVGSSSNRTLIVIQVMPLIKTIPQADPANEGENLTLFCNASGSSLEISWTKNGSGINSSEDTRIRLSGDNEQLTITNVSRTDNGAYRCVASNNVGKATSNATTVTVRFKPEISQAPSNTTKVEGQTAVFSCLVAGYATPNVAWTLNDVELNIETNTRLNVSQKDGNHSLTVTDVQQLDAGKYRCVARNSLGNSTSTPASLIVQFAPEVTIDGDQIQYVANGTDLQLTCRFNALPPVSEVQWVKDGNVIASTLTESLNGSRVDISHQNESQAQLLIIVVSLEDSGNYTCNVTNNVGSSSNWTSIVIQVKPSIETNPQADPANEGGNLTLFCNASGSSSAISWTKDGSGINSSEDKRIRLSKDNEQLTITNVSRTDSGAYQCVASNNVGKATSSAATVTVRFRPEISQAPSDTTKVEGQTAVFSCLVAGHPTPIVAWTKNDVELNIAANSRLNVSHKDGNHSLTVTNVKKLDAGKYRCVGNNILGNSTSSSATLTVQFTPEVAIDGDQIQFVADGTDLQLTCRFNALPPASEVQWIKDETVIASNLTAPSNGSRVNITHRNESQAQLSIKAVSLEDSGNYTCNVSNIVGSSSNRTSIIVQVTPTIEKDPIAVPVKEGENFTLFCNASGSSLRLSWTKNGSVIDPSDDSRIHLLADNEQLTITNASRRDNGAYQCVASNQVKNATSQAAIVTVQFAPEISQSPSNTVKVEGQTAVFSCLVAGYPEPDVAWIKNEVKLNASANVRLGVSFNDGNHQLTISKVQQSDAGIYRCEAANSLDTATSSPATLTVHFDPEVTIDGDKEQIVAKGDDIKITCRHKALPPASGVQWIKDGTVISKNSTIMINNSRLSILHFNETLIQLLINTSILADSGNYTCNVTNDVNSTSDSKSIIIEVKPSIASQPQSVSPEEGSNITLRCNATGSPILLMSWTYDGSVIEENENSRISLSNDSQELTITNVERGDSGEYRCAVKNTVGNDTSEPSVVNVLYQPEIVTHPKNDTLEEGLSLNLSCNAIGNPLPTLSWTKNGNSLSDNKGIIFSGNNETLSIANLNRTDSGNYRCVASNSLGNETSSGATVDVLYASEILENPKNAIIVEGKEAVFSCVVDGNPLPKVTWMKNEEKLNITDLRLTASSQNNNHSFTITNVYRSDSGQYRCVAFNNVGNLTSSPGTLTVQFAPEFSSSPLNVTVIEGQNVSVNCAVNGNPTSDVKWTKDGIDLSENDRISVSNFTGNTLSLTITNIVRGDEGQYRCVANNSVNTTTSSPGKLTVNFKADVEISGSEPKFVEISKAIKLTCRYTALPPVSKVQWVKDGNGIPQNGSAINNGRVNITQFNESQSQLLISSSTRDDEGNYTCFVTNAVGNSSSVTSVIIQVVPNPPKEVKVIAQGSQVVNISWTAGFDGNSDIQNYTVEIRENNQAFKEVVCQGTLSNGACVVSSSPTTASLTGLSPFTKYFIRVFATNTVGTSNSGSVVNATTDEEVPSAAPDFNLTVVNATAVNISWQMLSKEKARGTVLGYFVLYRDLTNRESPKLPWDNITVDGAGTTSYVVANLNEFTPHEFAMQAFNSKGVSVESVVQEIKTDPHKPSEPPQNVTLTVQSSRSILVAWEAVPAQERNGIIKGYKINFQALPDGKTNSTFLNITEGEENGQQITLDKLNEFTNYSIRVLAFTVVGDGPLSDLKVAQTLEDKPTASPSNVTGKSIGSTSISVTWDEVPPSHQNGIITSYNITYHALTENHKNSTTVDFPDRHFTLIGLREFVNYSITVFASTKEGDGPTSDPVFVTTDEDKPSAPPMKVAGRSISPTSISVTWDEVPATEQNGIITSYNISYHSLTENHRNSTKVDHPIREVNLTGLREFVNYSITVFASTVKGDGPASVPVFVRTDEDKPSATPVNVTGRSISSTSILVTWDKVPATEQNGIITSYNISYHSLTENHRNSTKVEHPIREVNLTGLREFVNYSITVFASTVKGDGPASVPVFVRTDEDKPSAPPVNVTEQSISSTSISVTWDEVPPSDQNGFITSYNITYYSLTENHRNSTTVAFPDRQVTLMGLKEFVNYSITVFASTKIGDGPASGPIFVRTAEDKPSTAPNDVKGRNISSTSILVEWGKVSPTDRNGIITSYNIMYHSQTEIRSNSTAVDYPNRQVTLTGLKKFVNYSITVSASTKIGPGPASYPIIVSTGEDKPSAAPVNVKGHNTSSTSILVTWDKVPAADQNGIITSYNITYHSLTEGQRNSTTVNYLSRRVTLTGLKEFVNYSITVFASTVKGDGPKSVPVVVSTGEDKPSASPVNVTGHSTSSTSILVTWGDVPAFEQNGIIRGYNVTYQSLTENHSNSTTLNYSNREVTLMSLREFVNYSITVSTFTKIGLGPASKPIFVTTDEGRPSAPPVNVRGINTSSTSIKVEWGGVPSEDRNGLITRYNITYFSLTEDDSNSTTVDYPDRQVVLKGLREFNNYSITVFASTVKGNGPASKAINVITGEDKPSAPPNDVRGQSTSSTSILVEWNDVPPDEQNGIITSYNIAYHSLTENHNGSTTVNYPGRLVTLTGLKEFVNYSIAVFATTVKGNGPKSVTVYVRTDPDEPSAAPNSVIGHNTSSTSILVRWDDVPPFDRNGIITSYNITYHSQKENHRNSTKVDHPNHKVNLTGLREFDNYNITVFASTVIGGGPSSEPIVVSTDEDIPSAAPKGLKLIDTAPTSLSVAWDEVPRTDQNGIIVNYTVRYQAVSGEVAVNKTVNSSTREANLTGLIKNMNYSIMVLASTIKGAGMFSTPIFAMTNQSVPTGSPQNLRGNNESAKSIFVEWDEVPPKEQHGQILNYTIFFKADEGSLVKKSLNSPKRSYVLEDLIEYTKYRIWVSASTIKGAGPKSDFIDVFTDEAVPSKSPDLISVQPVNSTSVEVEWKALSKEFIRGVPTKYTIHYKNSDGKAKTKIVPVKDKDKDEYIEIVNGLAQSTKYSFQVAVSTRQGEGPLSQSKSNVTGDPPKPGTPPKDDVGTTEVKIPFVPKQELSSGEKVSKYQVIVMELKEGQNKGKSSDSKYAIVTKKYEDSVAGKPYITAEFANNNEKRTTFPVGDGKYYSIEGVTEANRKRREAVVKYLNGKLNDGAKYVAFQRSFDSQGGYESEGLVDFETNKDYTVIIVAVVVVLLIVIAVIGGGIFFYRRRQRNPGNGEEELALRPQRRGRTLSKKILGRGSGAFDNPVHNPGESVPVEEFDEHVRRLHANGDLLFSQEYGSLRPQADFTWNATLAQENRHKNRYNNIVAYDHSRVKLLPIQGVPGSDYINANFLDGYQRKKAYIASQGPLPETEDDFWRMIWEQDSKTIVMVTNLEERGRIKCHQYWPSEGGKTYGDVQVALMQTVELSDFTIRTFTLKKANSRTERTLNQYHYTIWPDHGVPSCPTSLLTFVKKASGANPSDAGPMVVHCSAGVGRTGTFIVVDAMLQRIAAEKTVDVFGYVMTLRRDRNIMVQVEEQYVFIHEVLLEAIHSGYTEIRANDLRSHMKLLMQVSPTTGQTEMDEEFIRLGRGNAPQSKFQAANMGYNKTKNRYANVLAFDDTRVKLSMITGIEGSDYINANFIDGYMTRRAFIATQAPIPDTIPDFWRMIWEQESSTIVMLSKETESGKVKVHRYWPAKQPANIGTLVVEMTNEMVYEDYTVREIKLTNTKESASRVVRQYHYTGWPDVGSPESGTGLIDLIGQVQRWQQNSGNTTITVHCSAGVGRTGVFCALSILIERLKSEGVVDVFQTVKQLRAQRPAMVQTKDQYEFIYSALSEYLDSFDAYSNFE